MTRQQALHRAEAFAIRAALGLVRRLSPAAASDFGGAVARAIGPLLPVSRVAHANLRRALPELDAAARSRIVRGVWDNLGRTACEMPHAARLTWDLDDDGALARLARTGGPAIFITGHIGNWELLPRVAASNGAPLGILYRAAKNPHVDALIAKLRGAPPELLFPKGAAGARRAFGHLARGGVLGLLMDQKLNDGIAVPFFGRPAMTAPAAAAYALRFRCPLLPAVIRRTGPAHFRVVVEPPMALPDTGHRQDDILALTTEINRTLERWIRDWPEGWLWLHRRWPSEPKETS